MSGRTRDFCRPAGRIVAWIWLGQRGSKSRGALFWSNMPALVQQSQRKTVTSRWIMVEPVHCRPPNHFGALGGSLSIFLSMNIWSSSGNHLGFGSPGLVASSLLNLRYNTLYIFVFEHLNGHLSFSRFYHGFYHGLTSPQRLLMVPGLEEVDRLLHRPQDPKTRATDGRSALQLAAEEGHPQCVELLLEAGGAPKKKQVENLWIS